MYSNAHLRLTLQILPLTFIISFYYSLVFPFVMAAGRSRSHFFLGPTSSHLSPNVFYPLYSLYSTIETLLCSLVQNTIKKLEIRSSICPNLFVLFEKSNFLRIIIYYLVYLIKIYKFTKLLLNKFISFFFFELFLMRQLKKYLQLD